MTKFDQLTPFALANLSTADLIRVTYSDKVSATDQKRATRELKARSRRDDLEAREWVESAR